MQSSGMLHSVALVRTNVSEERSASIFRVTRIGVLGTLAVTSNLKSYTNLKHSVKPFPSSKKKNIT
jgi:hypothetical protein